MIQELNRIIFDPSCYACDRLLTIQERHICLYCLSQIEETHFHLKAVENELYHRFAGKFPLAGATSLYFYDKAGRFQTIMQALKYQESPQIGSFLGAYMGVRLMESPFLDGVDMILPVPLHWTKLAKRGYNQAEMIAKGLAKVTGIPANREILFRRRKTQTQARKTGAARWQNVAHAFGVRGELPKGILLVDDVVTTGSTLEACARALLEVAPEVQIRIACLGMARRR